MQQNIEVGSIWIDKSGEMPVIVLWNDKEEQRVSFEYLLVIDGKLDSTMANSSVDVFLKTKEPMVALSHSNKEYVKGKTEGYDEGYQHGYVVAKGKIAELDEQERQSIYYEGYDSGHNQWQDDYGFTVPNNTIKNLEATNYKKGLKDALLINDATRKHHYDMGYNDALAHMAWEESENRLELKKQGHEEGYDSGFEGGYNKALGEITECDFGSEGFCEHHNPSKKTQEAMQEVLDKYENELEGIWSAKDGSGKLEVVTINGDYCSVVLVEDVENSSLIAGDTLNLHINNLKKNWIKEFNNITNKDEQLEKEIALVEKYPHYYKDIRHLNIIDIYRFFDLFEVTDPCIQHSVKKLAVGGKRGAKDYEKDIKEAMDTLKRWEYMQEENKRGLDD